MKLRSQFRAAASSGSFWTEIGGGGDGLSSRRRSRRLCPALKPAHLDLPSLPPPSRKRKSSGCSPSLAKRRARKEGGEEEEVGFPSPVVSGDSEPSREGSGGDLIEATDSGSCLSEEIDEGVLVEQDKAPSPEIPLISTAEQEEENFTELEEEICVVNESPSYSDVSLDEDDREDTQETESATADEEKINPPPPASFEVSGVNSGGSFFELPWLHFPLDDGDYGMIGKPLMTVRDYAAVDYGGDDDGCGGGGRRRASRRTEIFAGMDYGKKMEVVCLYESLSLPFG